MNVRLSPVVSAVVIAAVVGGIFAAMWVITNRKGPHLPTGMGAAMQQSGANRGPTGGADKKD